MIIIKTCAFRAYFKNKMFYSYSTMDQPELALKTTLYELFSDLTDPSVELFYRNLP